MHRRHPEPVDGELLPRIGRSTACLLLLGTLAIGCSNLGMRAAVQAGSRLPELDGRVVAIEGRVASDPAPVGRSWSYALRSVRVLPDPANTAGSAREVTGRLWVRSYGKLPKVALGDLVRMEIKLARLDPAEPFDARMARRGSLPRRRFCRRCRWRLIPLTHCSPPRTSSGHGC